MGAEVVERARLESVLGLKPTTGSNPAPSAACAIGIIQMLRGLARRPRAPARAHGLSGVMYRLLRPTPATHFRRAHHDAAFTLSARGSPLGSGRLFVSSRWARRAGFGGVGGATASAL